MDGIEDALLAKSLYQGISSFLAPQSYAGSYSWGTPPLGLYMLSVCYKIFGDAYFVERFFSFGCALAQLGLITVLWKTIFNKIEFVKKYTWLPGLLWIISPLIGWSYSSNLLDAPMALFTTAAIIVSVNYCYHQTNLILSSAMVAAFIFLAFITKGPVALFVFAAPILFVSASSSYTLKRATSFLLLQLFFFATIFVLVFSFAAPRTFLTHYIEQQLKPALGSNGFARDAWYTILVEFVKATSFYLIGAAVLFLLRKKVAPKNSGFSKSWWRFISLGLCGSLPIIISAKQKSFYLLPAMVPIAVGFAIYLIPLLEWLKEKTSKQVLLWLEIFAKTGSAITILVCIFLSISTYGEIIHDGDMLNDLKQTDALLKNEKLISADSAFYGEWSLQAYSLRLYDRRICTSDCDSHFYITRPGHGSIKFPANAAKIFSGKSFDLYRIPVQ